ncbi:MAG: hypothetical protein R6W90_12470 [Ignavibacteriaceae bacterium]
MSKSKNILREKAKNSETLRDAINSEAPELQHVNQEESPKTIVNEEGKKVLVFKDPLYSKEKRSIINYSVFRGKWEFENIDDIDDDHEKCAVKFVPVKDGSSFTIGFKSLKDRVEFFDSIYSDKDMKQTGTGVSLEKIANSKVLQTTGGLVGLSVLSYGLYKFLKKKED